MACDEPTPADREAMAGIASLIEYAEASDQTLLAALLSEAADTLARKFLTLGTDPS